ncbi:MAG: hypothetical protein D3908_08935, partial [Candidatus Electrothrix sp. AUS4]|nr:hypothetical protein [Candidatus Electrothrix sp. AUS4]
PPFFFNACTAPSSLLLLFPVYLFFSIHLRNDPPQLSSIYFGKTVFFLPQVPFGSFFHASFSSTPAVRRKVIWLIAD